MLDPNQPARRANLYCVLTHHVNNHRSSLSLLRLRLRTTLLTKIQQQRGLCWGVSGFRTCLLVCLFIAWVTLYCASLLAEHQARLKMWEAHRRKRVRTKVGWQAGRTADSTTVLRQAHLYPFLDLSSEQHPQRLAHALLKTGIMLIQATDKHTCLSRQAAGHDCNLTCHRRRSRTASLLAPSAPPRARPSRGP